MDPKDGGEKPEIPISKDTSRMSSSAVKDPPLLSATPSDSPMVKKRDSQPPQNQCYQEIVPDQELPLSQQIQWTHAMDVHLWQQLQQEKPNTATFGKYVTNFQTAFPSRASSAECVSLVKECLLFLVEQLEVRVFTATNAVGLGGWTMWNRK